MKRIVYLLFLLVIVLGCQHKNTSTTENAKNERQVRNEQAVIRYQKAAMQGDANAQYNLGRCYDNGQGVSLNFRKAIKWYRKAAKQNNASAQHRLGDYYYSGQAVSRSYSKAVKWYSLAAEQGIARARYNLGFIYENGQGVTKDYKEAYKWYLLACSDSSNDVWEDASKAKDAVISKLSQSEITQAQSEAKALQEKIDSKTSK